MKSKLSSIKQNRKQKDKQTWAKVYKNCFAAWKQLHLWTLRGMWVCNGEYWVQQSGLILLLHSLDTGVRRKDNAAHQLGLPSPLSQESHIPCIHTTARVLALNDFKPACMNMILILKSVHGIGTRHLQVCAWKQLLSWQYSPKSPTAESVFCMFQQPQAPTRSSYPIICLFTYLSMISKNSDGHCSSHRS